MKYLILLLTGCLMILTSSCGKKKDRQDQLRVTLIAPDGSTLPHGAQVEVYANNELYFSGVTDEVSTLDPGSTSVLFTVEDRLSGEEERIENLQYAIITLGDSISNVNALNIADMSVFQYDLSTAFTQSGNFAEKQQDEVEESFTARLNYYGLFRGTTWMLTTAYLNGTETGVVSCAQDNYIEFDNLLPNPVYSEGSDVCPSSSGVINFGSDFNSFGVPINGSSAKARNLFNSYLQFDGQSVSLDQCYLIYPDTLVFSGTSQSNDFDYYFVKQ